MTHPISPAQTTDGARIRELLAAAGLPVADLETAPLQLWVARDNTRVVGLIGLERYGSAALLRSLCVDTSYQRSGVGRKLVFTLEQASRDAGVSLLVLLTQTAESFFTHLRYSVIDRAYVPDEILQSAEFRSLCPASATCMTKSLYPTTGVEST